MPPKKGLSPEDKRHLLLNFFTRQHSFYTLKEIEKDGSKFTKISPMIIKDTLKELIDENQVISEKCGTTNLYWSFGYDKYKMLKKQKVVLEQKLHDTSERASQLETQIKDEKAKRSKKCNSGLRKDLLAKFYAMEERSKLLQSDLEAISHNSPEVYSKLLEDEEKLRESIEFITDSIESMVYYFTRVADVPVEADALRKELGIPAEFDNFY